MPLKSSAGLKCTISIGNNLTSTSSGNGDVGDVQIF